jgi:hypothetical protein
MLTRPLGEPPRLAVLFDRFETERPAAGPGLRDDDGHAWKLR